MPVTLVSLTTTSSESAALAVTDIARHQFRVEFWVDAVALYNRLYREGRIVRVSV